MDERELKRVSDRNLSNHRSDYNFITFRDEKGQIMDGRSNARWRETIKKGNIRGSVDSHWPHSVCVCGNNIHKS